MRYTGSVCTDVGQKKQVNQDSCLYEVIHTQEKGNIVLAGICDGMGGLSEGELASATVLKALGNWFEQQLPQQISRITPKDIGESLKNLIEEKNRILKKYGDGKSISVGTTCSVILIVGDQYVIAHIGDSRIYCLDREAVQLTQDHSVVAREVRRGNLTPEQARRDPRRNRLLQCVGARDEINVEIEYGTIHPGICFLLCSDGLCHEIYENEMFQMLNEKKTEQKLEEVLRHMINLAINRGEKDNISAIAFQTEEDYRGIRKFFCRQHVGVLTKQQSIVSDRAL